MLQNVMLHFAFDKRCKMQHISNMSDELWSKVERVAESRKIPGATVRSWKHRGGVPANRRDELVDAAREIDVPLTSEELKTIQ